MSRSIHTTRQMYLKERKYQFRDGELKESRLRTIKEQLGNKRLLKEGKQLSRKLAKLPLVMMEGFDPTAIPIQITENQRT